MAETDDVAQIVDQILEGSIPEPKGELYIFDLVVHAREFDVEADFLTYTGDLFPGIRRSEDSWTPLSLLQSTPVRLGFPFSTGRLWRGLSELRDREGITFVPIGQARNYLRDGMIKFLTSRLRSLTDDAATISENRVSIKLPQASLFGFSSLRSNTRGFNITVSANTSGLRVHSSPTFRRSWSYFGSPTSPVKNALAGGIYEFGADGGPYSRITPDSGTFDIPYKTTQPSLAL